MASANGYKLEYTQGGQTFELVASWAAPFFVLAGLDTDEPTKPLLYHAESLADAKRFAAYGGRILNADFSELRA